MSLADSDRYWEIHAMKNGKRKPLLWTLVGVVCAAALALTAFLITDRAGGEIGFDAVIISVEGDWITADVTDDGASLLSKKLPDVIMFDASDSGVTGLRPGDHIHGDYLSGTIEGSRVRVVGFAEVSH